MMPFVHDHTRFDVEMENVVLVQRMNAVNQTLHETRCIALCEVASLDYMLIQLAASAKRKHHVKLSANLILRNHYGWYSKDK